MAATLPLLAILAAWPPSAFGHAAFLESTPAPGTRLDSSPRLIALEYTEPLIEKLTSVTVTRVGSDRAVRATLRVVHGRGLTALLNDELPTGAYRVKWHTVSTEDGHALEGSFGFGVGTDAVGGAQAVQQSPLARGGWLRIALRGLFYAALVFFAGGLLAAVLLSAGRGPADWLIPGTVAPERLADVAARSWARTVDAGWLAVGAGIGAVLLEGADAAGGLSADGMAEFLLSSVAGVARVLMIVALVLAVLLATARRVPAVVALCLAFLGIALGGHANSAEQPQLAVASDWLHLVAGSAWLGGIAQLAAAWWHIGRATPADARRDVMRQVLRRFGRLAVPAFAIVVLSGLVNALLQLGTIEALWTTAYGLVLTAKIALVGLIGVASYLHATRLRPRILSATATDPPGRLERRHWSLLRSEPVLGVTVIAAAAALVAFPLPPRQLADASEAAAPAVPPCDPCPQPAAGRYELPVAEHAGSFLVAAWVRRTGADTQARVRVLGRGAAPAAVDARVRGAVQRSCGRGCWTVRLPGRPRSLAVEVAERGRRYVARLPVEWEPDGERAGRQVLARAQRAMRSLASWRVQERITSGPGSLAVTRYAFKAPNRMTYTVDGGSTAVTVGATQWFRVPELGRWERDRSGGFTTRSWFRWTTYADRVQLLRRWSTPSGPRAEVALYDRATPVWHRLLVDLRSHRVLSVRMIAEGHFMTQRYFAFDQPISIQPPDVDAR